MTTKEAISVLKEEGKIFSITNKRLYEAIRKAAAALDQEKSKWIRPGIHPMSGELVLVDAPVDFYQTYQVMQYLTPRSEYLVKEPGFYTISNEGIATGPFEVIRWRYIF